MPRDRRKPIIALVALAAAILVYVFVIDPLVRPMFWRWQSVAALKAANNTAGLYQAVGRNGVYIPIKDGSWIAIRYRESRSSGGPALAIASDSGGSWFESTVRFGDDLARFADWVHTQSQPDAVAAHAEFAGMRFDNGHGDLRDIFNAANLDQARAALIRAGFAAMHE